MKNNALTNTVRSRAGAGVEHATIGGQQTFVGVALVLAVIGAGCNDSSSPEGQIVASWALTRNQIAMTCDEALVDRVRVTAVNVNDGDAANSGPLACGDGSGVVAVEGGTYLVGVDTLAPDDAVIDHGEMIVVAANLGETEVSVRVETSLPTGFIRARWSPPCPSGTDSVTLVAVEENVWKEFAPCTPGEVTSDPVPLGTGTARLIWWFPNGTVQGEATRPYELTGRGQVVDIQF